MDSGGAGIEDDGESVDLSDSQRVRPWPLDNTLWIVFCLFVGRSEEAEGGRLNLLLLTLIWRKGKDPMVLLLESGEDRKRIVLIMKFLYFSLCNGTESTGGFVTAI